MTELESLGNFLYDPAHVLGRGSFGTVWRGHHRDDLHFEVAIKLLHLQPGAVDDHLEQAKADFLREARILRRLQHPGIVRLFDFSWNEGRPYLVMELLPGGSLLKRLKGGPPLTVGEALTLTVQIAQALEVAHGSEVVHRDLKPDNIMLRDDALTPVITDFGIARLDELTRSISTQIGTPLYMAPEQFQGRAISGRTDVYALGILFHELLTGRVPYWSKNPFELSHMHLHLPIPQLPTSLAPLQEVIERMLAKDPDARFPTAAAVVESLRQTFLNDAALRTLVGYAGSGRAWSSQLRALGFELPLEALAEVRVEQGRSLRREVPQDGISAEAPVVVAELQRTSEPKAAELPQEKAHPSFEKPVAPLKAYKHKGKVIGSAVALAATGILLTIGWPRPEPAARGLLLVRSDADCALRVDGLAQGVVLVGVQRSLEVAPGPRHVLCVSQDDANVAAEQLKTVAEGDRETIEFALATQLADQHSSEAEVDTAVEPPSPLAPDETKQDSPTANASPDKTVTTPKEKKSPDKTGGVALSSIAKTPDQATQDSSTAQASRDNTVTTPPVVKATNSANQEQKLPDKAGTETPATAIPKAPGQTKLEDKTLTPPPVVNEASTHENQESKSPDQLGTVTPIPPSPIANAADQTKQAQEWFEEGLAHFKGVGVTQSDAEAARLWRLSAEKGHARAQSKIGLMYQDGRGVARNDAEAVRWYRLAADQGDADGQSGLGFMYDEGRGVPENVNEAVRLYKLAADQGNARGQNNLGHAYDEGRGVPKSATEAVRLYKLSAQQGFDAAQANLGYMYDEGLGVRKSATEAVRWYKLAAAQGDAVAQTNLGLMYEEGRGVRKSATEAVRWYKLAANQGHANAQFNLGIMYFDGRGVRKSATEAARWFQRAADQGDAQAQFNLGFMHEGGLGVPRSATEAIRWYKLAAAQGETDAAKALKRLEPN